VYCWIKAKIRETRKIKKNNHLREHRAKEKQQTNKTKQKQKQKATKQ
jgi:hypothetical protein